MPENTNQSKLSNYSINFDPTSFHYINCGTLADLNNISAFSTSTWLNVSVTPTGVTQVFLSGGTGSSNRFWVQLISLTQLRYGSGSAFDDITISELSLNTWYHIVTLHNGTSLDVYLNGDKQNASPITVVAPNTLIGNSFSIGRYFPGGYYFNGKLNEISIFNYILSESQITYLYELNNPMAITGAEPIAYYPLGDNSNPTSLAGYPNVSVGGSVFSFDGSDDYINLGDLSNIGVSNASAVSVSLWFKKDGDGNYVLFELKEGSSKIALQSYLANGLYIYINNVSYNVAVTVANNEWHNIMLVFDGNGDLDADRLKLYFNGSNITGGTYSASVPTAVGAFTSSMSSNIGRTPATAYFDGELSNVQVFNTALSSTEITTLYNNGSPLTSMSGFSSLLAWYKLDNSEIYNNTSTEWSIDNNQNPSTYKSSLNFNSDGISIASTATTPINPTGDYSISAWVNPSNVTTANQIFTKYGNTDSTRAFGFLIHTDGKLRLLQRATGVTNNTFSANSILANVWTHVAVVRSESNESVSLYINGVLDGGVQENDFIPNNGGTEDLRIGRNNSTPSITYFTGQISNVSIFNTELSSSQIQTIYNNGTPEASISNSPTSWYKLNNTTTGIQDSAGSNNGTNEGATEYAGFVNALGGESDGMNSTNLIQSTLYRQSPYSSYSVIFNATDSFDFNNASSNMMSGKTDISISAWFKLASNTTSAIASNWYSSGNARYLLRYNSDSAAGIQWYIRMAGTSYTINSRFLPNVGDWVHVVGVKDSVTAGGQMRLYINGAESSNESPKNNTNFADPLATLSFSDQIGAFNNTSSLMNGNISNVAYWTNTALTLADVVEIYNAGVPTDLSSFDPAPSHWCTLDSKKVYYNGSVIVARDAISTLQATGVNLVRENITGNAPGSNANGTGNNLTIADLKGDMNNSTKNAYSVNMADYGNPNNQGVTPANSGRTTSVPG